MKRMVVILAILAFVFSCQKKDDSVIAMAEEIEREEAQAVPAEVESSHRYAWVDSPGGLRMRAEPVLGEDNTVEVIPHEEELEILGLQEDKVEIAGLLGHWYRVRWYNIEHGTEGWVFGAFLSFEDPKPEITSEESLSRVDGFYVAETDDLYDLFIAIHNNEARILQNHCQGFSIAEGHVVLSGSKLTVNTGLNSFIFETRALEESPGYSLFLEQTGLVACGPFSGDHYFPVSYQAYLESNSWGSWLSLEEQTQGWGQWFGDKTIVYNTPEFGDMGEMDGMENMP